MIATFLKLAGILFLICTGCLVLTIAWGKWERGSVISFITRDSVNPDILLLDIHTRIFLNLSNSPEDEWTYIWSPDGQQILYTVPGMGRGDTLFLMDSNGSNRRMVESPRTPLVFGLQWSPDQQQVAYFSSHPHNVSDLYIIDLPTDQTNNITNTPEISEESPVWSPDGNTLLYLRGGDLYQLDLATNQHHALTHTPENEFNPVWSPDGRMIAFQRNQETESQQFLYYMEQDSLVPILIGPSSQQPASWSPDQQFIAFTDPQQRIWIYNREDQEARLLDESTERRHNPIWSPDGEAILFIQNRAVHIYWIHEAKHQIIADNVRMQAPVIWKP